MGHKGGYVTAPMCDWCRSPGYFSKALLILVTLSELVPP